MKNSVLEKLRVRRFADTAGGNLLVVFYPRDAVIARVFARATCPSVRLSHAGIVSKRRKLAS